MIRRVDHQWSLGGAEIAGASAASIVASAPGEYRCRVTATNHAGATAQTSDPHAVMASPPPPTSSAFRFGKLRRNPRRGTATLAVSVPGPGTLVLVDPKLIRQVTAHPSAATTLELTIKPKGKAFKSLRRKGTAKLKLTLTNTPTGGSSDTERRTVRLVRWR